MVYLGRNTAVFLQILIKQTLIKGKQQGEAKLAV